MLPEMDTLEFAMTDYVIPSKTPRIVVDKQVISGSTDELEAVRQAIYIMLNTERYEHIIFSWDYGVELRNLFGKPISYVIPELERRINEALLTDDRILSTSDWEFSTTKHSVTARWTTNTIFGEIKNDVEVQI